jgi:hypothetical protein
MKTFSLISKLKNGSWIINNLSNYFEKTYRIDRIQQTKPTIKINKQNLYFLNK